MPLVTTGGANINKVSDMRPSKLHCFVALLALVELTYAAPARSAAAVAAFKRANPCPANGASKGKCPGYVVDHIEPLCAGGKDAPSNMQWQTVAEAKQKDKQEREQCRVRRKASS